MGRFVIVGYAQTRQGKAVARPGEKASGCTGGGNLIADRPGYVVHAVDGSIVEVSEWRSAQAIAQAHANAAVGALWAEFAEACDYTPLARLQESQQMFAEFDALSL